jgi:hypothetical protein
MAGESSQNPDRTSFEDAVHARVQYEREVLVRRHQAEIARVLVRPVMHHESDLGPDRGISDLISDADIKTFIQRSAEKVDPLRTAGLYDPEYIELLAVAGDTYDQLRRLYKAGRTILVFEGPSPMDPAILDRPEVRSQLASDIAEAAETDEVVPISEEEK